MKYLKSIITALLITNCIFAQSDFASNQIIVQLKAQYAKKVNANPNNIFLLTEIETLNSTYKLDEIKAIGNQFLNIYLLNFNTNENLNDVIKAYTKSNIFEYVEPNYIAKGGGKQGSIIPKDQYFSRQYALYNDGSFSLSPAVEDADIDMELAWEIEKGDSNIIVAILDSGAKLDHPELSNRIWKNNKERENKIDNDQNGYTDDIIGWDFINNDNMATDDHGHGTNVTGIIGAEANNEIGYAGVDWNCKLMICKVLDDENRGPYSNMVNAIVYAVDNGANVINMSIGGTGRSTALHNAVKYAYENNVAVVACMMNINSNTPFYPAAFEETIAVGSTDANDERSAPFFWDSSTGSNYGEHIDVVAPGNYMYGLSSRSNTNYSSYWGGTSQAAPLVTGLFALLLAQDLLRTPEDLRLILTSTAEDLTGNKTEDLEGFDIYYGHGRVNAYDALNQNMMMVSNIVPSIKNKNVKIINNPTSNNWVVENNTNEMVKFSVYSLSGTLILESDISTGVSHLPINACKSGLYIVKFESVNGFILRNQKIIVEN